MKELKTITEYQLLFLARKELSRRINKAKDEIIKNGESRRINNLLDMYTKQIGEVIGRMAEIQKGNAENDD